jgi:5-methylcytosine-specific restriction endonuclease McrA
MSEYACDECKKFFLSKRNLTNHVNGDSCKIANYCCSMCIARFTTSTSMYRHMKHTCKFKKAMDNKQNQIHERLEQLEKQNKLIIAQNAQLQKKVKTMKKCIKESKVQKPQLNPNPSNPLPTPSSKKPTDKIPRPIRKKVWKQNIGNTLQGFCYVCDDIIENDNFDCGHVVSRKDGGTIDINNLRPICRPCNLGCGTMNLDDYRESVMIYF